MSEPRSRATFVDAFLLLLPEGPVWPRTMSSRVYGFVAGLMGVVGRWAADAWRFLHVEAFPPTSFALLPDWERVLGLPEPCLPVPTTLAERRQAVIEKLQRRPGGQSRAYFLELGRRLGYHEAGPSPYALPLQLPGQVGQLRQMRIREYRPFMAGVSRAGDPRWQVGHHSIRFFWTVTVPDARLTWFRAGGGGGRSGVDPHVRIRQAEDLECLFKIYKPAHTICLFDYQGD